jgi:hypothetical protein
LPKRSLIVGAIAVLAVSSIGAYFLLKSTAKIPPPPPPPPPPGSIVITATYNGQNFDLSPITVIDQTTGQQIAQGTSPLTLPLSDFNSTDNYTASVYYCYVPSLYEGNINWTGLPSSSLTINVTRYTVDHCPQ